MTTPSNDTDRKDLDEAEELFRALDPIGRQVMLEHMQRAIGGVKLPHDEEQAWLEERARQLDQETNAA